MDDMITKLIPMYNEDDTRGIGRAFTNTDSNAVDQVTTILNSLPLHEGKSSVFIENPR